MKNKPDKAMSNISFRIMCFFLRRMNSKAKIDRKLDLIPINKGDIIVDYGCASGHYSIIAAKKVGKNGKVYAVDIHPLSAKYVRNAAKKDNLDNLSNIEPICTSKSTGISPNSVDKVILFDVFQMFKDPNPILKELHSILKKEGKLAVELDHSMSIEETIKKIEATKLFKLKIKIDKLALMNKL